MRLKKLAGMFSAAKTKNHPLLAEDARNEAPKICEDHEVFNLYPGGIWNREGSGSAMEVGLQ